MKMDLKIIKIMILFIILAGFQYTLSKILEELRKIRFFLEKIYINRNEDERGNQGGR